MIKQKFEFPLNKTGEEDDQFLRGEFDVIKELLAQLPGATEAKQKIDRLIDLCGPAPKGTGIQNLRECIIQTKWKYDVAPEDKQVRCHTSQLIQLIIGERQICQISMFSQ